jgi:hypothetical protein
MNEKTVPLTAKQPEHCHKCYRLIHSGETYYQTAKNTVLCEQCAAVEPLDSIQATDGLTVEIHEDHLKILRGDTGFDVRLAEVRHLVDALVDAAVRLVNYQMHGSLELSEASDDERKVQHTEEQLAAWTWASASSDPIPRTLDRAGVSCGAGEPKMMSVRGSWQVPV